MNWISNASLKDYNTFGIEARAAYFASFDSLESLKELLDSKPEHFPIMILGGGSNMLLVKDVNACVLHHNVKGIEVISENEKEVLVRAGGGEVWHDLVMYSVNRGWGGLENLSLIPGYVGAAPIQNIGAYGVELKDCFVSLDAINIHSKRLHTFNHALCEFGYRDSIFKNGAKGHYVILNVTLRLQKNPRLNLGYGAIQKELENRGIKNPNVKDVSKVVMAIRRSKLPDPMVLGNSGSFFKNPIVSVAMADSIQSKHPDLVRYDLPAATSKLAAGWLIEQAGWKGYREGDAGVHEKQALVLVNHGKASGEDIWNLATKIIEDVHAKFGVRLEPEVNILQ